MKVLVEKETNHVIASGEEIEKVLGGYKIGDYTYLDNGNFEVQIIENVPNDVTPRKYILLNGDITPNPNYIEVKPVEEIVTQLQERINLLQQALDDLLLGGM